MTRSELSGDERGLGGPSEGPVHRPILALLGLARKAGQLQLGARAVLRALHSEPPGVVFLARDAGSDLAGRIERVVGISKLDRRFTGEELASAFQRDRLAVVSVHERGFVSGLMGIMKPD